MRRFLRTGVVVLLVAASCSDEGGSTTTSDSSTTTSSTTTTAPAPSTTAPASPSTSTTASSTSTTTAPEWPGAPFGASPLPDVLIADGTMVTLVSSAAENPADWMTDAITTEHPVTEIRITSDGTIVTEEIVGDEAEGGLRQGTEVVRYRTDGDRAVVDGASRLYDVAVVGGAESMIVGLSDDNGAEPADRGLVAVRLDNTGIPVALGLAAGAEFGVTHVDWVAGLGVVTAWADLTESVSYRTIEGNVELPTPTEGIEYNGPPYVTAATLSADGSIVFWAEGPDWGYDSDVDDAGPIPGEWRVKSLELSTGEMRLDFPVSDVVLDTAELSVSSLHHTGDHLIINRTTVIYDEQENLRPLVLDFTNEEPDLYELPLHGVATPVP